MVYSEDRFKDGVPNDAPSVHFCLYPLLAPTILLMDNIQSQIEKIETEMAKTPYHKGTEGWFGLMRAKISKLKTQLIDKQTSKSGGGGGFAVRKFGDATVVLVGFPSVGKSTLLNALTNAKSPTAEYAFTTVSVIPGMMDFRGAQIQILDVPGLIEGAAKGSGRGREVLSVIRGADLLLIIAENGREEDQWRRMVDELYINGVRINEIPPQVIVKKALRGGVKINTPSRQNLDRQTIIDVAKEFGVTNAEITIREKLTLDRLIDAFSTNRVYVPALFLLNKIDKDSKFENEYEDDVLAISAERDIGLEELREKIWETLGLIRVYLRDPHKSLSFHLRGGSVNVEPMIMHNGQTLKELLDLLGNDAAMNALRRGKTEAKIWGSGARFPGQTVSFSTKVQDGMMVTFV